MAGNGQNVYFGPDALKKYFDPDSAPPLPLVELPEYLNPFYKDGVRIYAKMMTMHPANNVKAMPGMHLPASVLPSVSTFHCILTTDSHEHAPIKRHPQHQNGHRIQLRIDSHLDGHDRPRDARDR